MDKKLAEEEAVRKAKDQQAAAGKNSGMSGRDLVGLVHHCYLRGLTLLSVYIQPRVVRRRGRGRRRVGPCEIPSRAGRRRPRTGRRENTRFGSSRRRIARRVEHDRGLIAHCTCMSVCTYNIGPIIVLSFSRTFVIAMLGERMTM
jgi:hypothetical protein